MVDTKIIVQRDSSDQTIETKGKLQVDTGIQSLFECLSLELPWKDNKRGISCIPLGIYDWVKVGATANIPYPHIAIKDVPNRSGICIHAANYAAGAKVQIKGCIAVGKLFADINGDGIDDITTSRATFDKLMDLLPSSGKIIIM